MAGKHREPHATTDEDPTRVTVGDVRPLDGPVTLVEYDPAWPQRYAALARVIQRALTDAVVLVEHAGSTAVPGLVAKPIVDVVRREPFAYDVTRPSAATIVRTARDETSHYVRVVPQDTAVVSFGMGSL